MRSPDEDATTGDDGSVSSSLGDGFGASADDLSDGFGEGDLSDDDVSVDDVEVEEGDDGFDFPGDDGDGLSDDEASNVLEEILEDVFGEDGPEVLDESQTASFGDAFTQDAFEPGDMPSESDFDLTGDGHVDGHDLHEAAHPFDFDVT